MKTPINPEQPWRCCGTCAHPYMTDACKRRGAWLYCPTGKVLSRKDVRGSVCPLWRLEAIETDAQELYRELGGR